jgi:hypothetical protein
MKGYKELIESSDAVSENDLRHIFDDDVQEKLSQNPLKHLLKHLGTLYIQRSQEEVERTAKKDKLAKTLREQRKPSVAGKPEEPAIYQHSLGQDTSSTTTTTNPRYPSTLPSTPQKRNASEASLDPASTHTTPKKLVKAEAVIQNLQNLLILEIFEGLFRRNSMEIQWPQGRKMRLLYAEYHLSSERC